MKGKVKFLVILAIVATMALPVLASATSSQPYSAYDAWFQSTDEGCAAIYRCSCSPVNNYLSASAKVQYQDGGSYRWSGTTSSSGTNVQERAFVINSPSGKYVNYVDAAFEARCGSGSTKNYSDTASR